MTQIPAANTLKGQIKAIHDIGMDSPNTIDGGLPVNPICRKNDVASDGAGEIIEMNAHGFWDGSDGFCH